MDKTISVFLAGLVIGIFIAILLVVSQGVSIYSLASTSSQANNTASVTVNKYLEVTVTPSTIEFGALDPGTNSNATNDPINITNTPNSNTAVDVYLKGTDLVNGSYVIGVGNLTISKSEGGSETAMTSATWLSGAGPDAGYFENVAKNTKVQAWFNITIPSTQEAGYYTGNVTIKSVQDGLTP